MSNTHITKSTRMGAVLLAGIILHGCSTFDTGAFTDNAFWANGPIAENDHAELGIAELAKGNNVGALKNFERALKINPNDVHALFGSALVYQNTGNPARASEYYSRIAAMDPQPTDEIMLWTGSHPQSISELAKLNLTIMNPGSVSVASSDSAGMPQSEMYMMPTQKSSVASRVAGDQILFKDADKNIVERFRVLRSLAEQGLITRDEFAVRRQQNAGALLPMTMDQPSVGLDRPVPPADQIINRLRAISRALEMRAITVNQHSAERQIIIDALMPASPAARAIAPVPPTDMMAAADAIRRLEMMREAGLITDGEYKNERAALENHVRSAASGAAPAQEMTAVTPSAPQALSMNGAKKLSGFAPGIHLASYRQQKQAERGWASLQKRFSSQLGELQMSIEQVDLGAPKGVFYRLKAGPLPSNDAAVSLCARLKRDRQYCDPTTVNFN